MEKWLEAIYGVFSFEFLMIMLTMMLSPKFENIKHYQCIQFVMFFIYFIAYLGLMLRFYAQEEDISCWMNDHNH